MRASCRRPSPSIPHACPWLPAPPVLLVLQSCLEPFVLCATFGFFAYACHCSDLSVRLNLLAGVMAPRRTCSPRCFFFFSGSRFICKSLPLQQPPTQSCALRAYFLSCPCHHYPSVPNSSWTHLSGSTSSSTPFSQYQPRQLVWVYNNYQ